MSELEESSSSSDGNRRVICLRTPRSEVGVEVPLLVGGVAIPRETKLAAELALVGIAETGDGIADRLGWTEVPSRLTSSAKADRMRNDLSYAPTC